MNTKIIFFDIDGTILSHRNHKISDSTRNAIRKAKENGHLVFINTGRTWEEIDHYIKDIDFDGYVCGCGTYIHHRGKTLLQITIPSEIRKMIVQDLRTYHIEAVLEGTYSIHFDFASNFPPLLRIRDKFQKEKQNVLDWSSDELDFDKFCVWFRDSKDSKDYSAFLGKYQDMFDYIDRGEMYEIVPKGCSKASGIAFLLNHLGIPHENAYALGDSSNDLSMLNYVIHSIGMGNSEKEVIKAVKYLTKDVDEGGVEHALRHYSII